MKAIERLKYISCSFTGNNIIQPNSFNTIQKIKIVELDQGLIKILFPLCWDLLTSLDFAFVDITKATSQDIKALCTDGLQNLPQLQSLSLKRTQALLFVLPKVSNLS